MHVSKMRLMSQSFFENPYKLLIFGVDDGTRTHDNRNHNPIFFNIQSITYGRISRHKDKQKSIVINNAKSHVSIILAINGTRSSEVFQ